LFCRRKYEEGVRFGTEIEVFGETRCNKKLAVRFQLEQIVLRFPCERNYFEFTKVLLGALDIGAVMYGGHVVKYELFAPLNDTLDYIK